MNYTTTEDSEAAHLCEIYDDESRPYEDFLAERASGVAHDERHYKLNKKAKVGTKIVCAGPKCNNRFIKKSYQQCFCCTRHKDQFWNRREAQRQQYSDCPCHKEGGEE